jgi:uncharacterized RDD family membrane protein YckC
MDAASQGNRYAPPTAHVADVAQEANVLATRWQRFWAAMVDGILLMAVMGLISLVAPRWISLTATSRTAWELIAYVATSFGVYLLLNGFMLATQGQTLGKSVLGIRVVRPNGDKASLLRLVAGRQLPMSALVLIPVVGPVVPLVDCVMVFRSSRRCLHDQIADTIVVKA